MMGKKECLELLKNTRSAMEWNAACDKIRASDPDNQYPAWWYSEVVSSGFWEQVAMYWMKR